MMEKMRKTTTPLNEPVSNLLEVILTCYTGPKTVQRGHKGGNTLLEPMIAI